MDTLLRVNQIVLDDEKRLNEAFVKEAIVRWDLGKTNIGSFCLFVEFYIRQKWFEYVKQN